MGSLPLPLFLAAPLLLLLSARTTPTSIPGARSLPIQSIPRITLPAPLADVSETFLVSYFGRSQPVVLDSAFTDAWRGAIGKWQDQDYFASLGGNAYVEVQMSRKGNANYYEAESNQARHKGTWRWSDFAHAAPDLGNDVYVTANNRALSQGRAQDNSNISSKSSSEYRSSVSALREALLADLGPLPSFLVPHGRGSRNPDPHLWWGSGETITPLHHDVQSVCHVQVTGRKRWLLVPPEDYALVGNFRGMFARADADTDHARRHEQQQEKGALFAPHIAFRRFEAVLSPGDAIFVPMGWWHQVHAIGEIAGRRDNSCNSSSNSSKNGIDIDSSRSSSSSAISLCFTNFRPEHYQHLEASLQRQCFSKYCMRQRSGDVLTAAEEESLCGWILDPSSLQKRSSSSGSSSSSSGSSSSSSSSSSSQQVVLELANASSRVATALLQRLRDSQARCPAQLRQWIDESISAGHHPVAILETLVHTASASGSGDSGVSIATTILEAFLENCT